MNLPFDRFSLNPIYSSTIAGVLQYWRFIRVNT